MSLNDLDAIYYVLGVLGALGDVGVIGALSDAGVLGTLVT